MKIPLGCGVLLLAACAGPYTGPEPIGHGAYVLQKIGDGGRASLGPLKESTYAEARAYCASSGLAMGVVQYDEVEGKQGQASRLQLVFECAARS